MATTIRRRPTPPPGRATRPPVRRPTRTVAPPPPPAWPGTAAAREVAAVALGWALLTAVVATLLTTVTELYLPLDAAHLLAEGEQLRGVHDVLPLLHPPLFPGLVAGATLGTDRYEAMAWVMAGSAAAYAVALYALVRSWARPGPAAVGAAVGAFLPVQAEILGWGGGANLLGLAAALGAIAVTERWLTSDRHLGFGVGALLGAAAACHPFAFLVALAVVGGRVGWHLAETRRVAVRSWGPGGAWGAGSVAAGALPLVAVSLPYYTAVSEPGTVGPRLPDLTTLADLLAWAGRDSPVFVTVMGAGVALPLLLRRGGARPTAVLLALVVVGVTTALDADPSYQSRAMYVAPALVALGVGLAFDPVTRAVARALRRSVPGVGAAVAVIAVVLTVQFGYWSRLERAVPYYSRPTVEDVAALAALEGGEGVVASSWWGDDPAEPTSWFVNGISRRESWAPIGPWLSTVPAEREAGQAMQQLFAGQVGVEDDRIQLAAWATEAGQWGLQLGVRSRDFFFPYGRLDLARSRLPFTVARATARLDGGGVVLELRGAGSGVVEIVGRLDGSGGATVTARVVDGPPGDFHLVFVPPPGRTWTSASLDGRTARTTQAVGDDRPAFTWAFSADGPVTVARTYQGDEPVDFDAVGATAGVIRWAPARPRPSGPRRTFSEAALLRGWDVTEVVVWRNTGLVARFDDRCFTALARSANLVTYRVRQPCER